MKSPRSVSISITGKCNLSCRHCLYADEMRRFEDLPTEDWLDFIRECGDASVMYIGFTGGEPFIRPDFRRICEETARSRMRFNVLTNGTLIDENTADWLAGTGRVRRIQVSVDGDEKMHEWVRGPGTYSKALRAIELLSARGMHVDARMTLITKDNLNLDAAVTRVRNAGAKRMTVAEIWKVGRACERSWNASSEVTKPEINESIELLRDKHGDFLTNLGLILQDKNDDAVFDDSAWRLKPGKGCRVGEQEIHVRHDGAYLPCLMFDNPHVLGYIYDTQLLDVWENNPFLRALRDGELPESGTDCIAMEISRKNTVTFA